MANVSLTNKTLEEVNDAMALLLIPAMAYTGIMMVVGVFGNLLVVYVFPAKLKGGSQNLLVTSLAVFDLLICLISMPTEITDMRYFYMFDSEFACKMFRFVNTFGSMCSILTLLSIAVDRYQKVCKPHKKQMEAKQVKIALGVTVLLSAIMAWPAVLIFGIRTAETGVDGLVGRDCSTSDAVKNTIFPLVYNAILAVLFIICTVVLAVLYYFVWKEAKKHVDPNRRSTMSPSKRVTTIELSSADSGDSVTNKYSPHHRTPSRRKGNKTTTIAFLVTIVFILSFLPYLSLVVVRAVIKDFDYSLEGAGIVFFNLFLRSYFVNSASNPIIYGVMNIRFRMECTKLIKKLYCCGRV